MSEIAAADLEKAFLNWYRKYSFKETDESVLPFLNSKISAVSFADLEGEISRQQNQAGQLEKARKALFLSTQNLADKIEIVPQMQAGTDIEVNEASFKVLISKKI